LLSAECAEHSTNLPSLHTAISVGLHVELRWDKMRALPPHSTRLSAVIKIANNVGGWRWNNQSAELQGLLFQGHVAMAHIALSIADTHL